MHVIPGKEYLRLAIPTGPAGKRYIEWRLEFSDDLEPLLNSSVILKTSDIVFCREEDLEIPVWIAHGYLDAGITTFDPADEKYRRRFLKDPVRGYREFRKRGTMPRLLTDIEPPEVGHLYCLEQWNLPDRKRRIFRCWLGF